MFPTKESVYSVLVVALIFHVYSISNLPFSFFGIQIETDGKAEHIQSSKTI